jgi:beta-aspartyl-peptidase (threonine type)
MPLVMVASGNGAVGLPAGVALLRRGASALDAVVAATKVVEDNPVDHSVGTGGLPNVLGEVELDASIMDGRTRHAGAVCALRGFRHPIEVARLVMERLPHVLLAGDGAARFARECGCEEREPLTAAARELWRKRLRRLGQTPQSVAGRRRLAPLVWRAIRAELGTVNFLALDRRGELAAAVSTSGWAYKYPGRVGDSPIIGAGNYCDSRYGAAACTGFGELAIRAGTARTAIELLAGGAGAGDAARGAIARANALEGRVVTRLNIVVLRPDGSYAAATTARGVRYAVMTSGMRRAKLIARTVVRAKR